jgi:hypothetical protein
MANLQTKQHAARREAPGDTQQAIDIGLDV